MHGLKHPAAGLAQTVIRRVLGGDHIERAQTARITEPPRHCSAVSSFTIRDRDSLRDGFRDASQILRPLDRVTFVRLLNFQLGYTTLARTR